MPDNAEGQQAPQKPSIALYFEDGKNEWQAIAINGEAIESAGNAYRVLKFMQAMDARWTGMIFGPVEGRRLMLAESYDYVVDTNTPGLSRVLISAA